MLTFSLFAIVILMMSNSGGEEIRQNNSSEEAPLRQVARRRRRQAGTPDSDCEIIALSRDFLMTTRKYICEICNRECCREQNLVLHRRIHNPNWNLAKRIDNQEKRKKKAYICPETNCVHHNPSRALSDIYGLKNHYLRKHGEKIWRCEKCSKRYAVESDLKNHSKSCGTKHYQCNYCGVNYFRIDKFETHKISCEILKTMDEIPTGQDVLTNFSFVSDAIHPVVPYASGVRSGFSVPPIPVEQQIWNPFQQHLSANIYPCYPQSDHSAE